MTHVETYLGEYLRGELGRRRTEEVAAHLARCPRCAAHADWLRQLEDLATDARREPPAEIVSALEARLLALPELLGAGTAGTAAPTAPPKRRGRTVAFPAWPAVPAAAVRTAAAVLLGVLLGYGLWGPRSDRSVPSEEETGLTGAPAPALAARRSQAAIAPASEMEFPGGAGATDELEARVARLERLLLRDHLGRVEAAITYFMSGTSEGRIVTMPAEVTRSLLSTTASLKLDYRSAGDEQLTRLLGQIESVLTEIERICCNQDLPGAVTVASRIEDGGFLSTLQRMKVGIEE